MDANITPFSVIEHLPPGADSVLYRVRARNGHEICLKTVRRWHRTDAEHAPLRAKEGRNSPYYRKRRQLVNEYKLGRDLSSGNGRCPFPRVVGMAERRFFGWEWGCDLFLEYIPGRDFERLRNRRKLDAAIILNAVFDVAKALAYLHAHGVVHLDVKLSNLIFTSTGARVVDLGIAKSIGVVPHAVTGTPGYMAPEQLKADEPVDQRADVYALGVVMNVLFGGDTLGQSELVEQPARMRKAMATMAMQEKDTFLSLLHFRRGSKHYQGMEELVAECTVPDPRSRIDSMDQVIKRLQRIAERNNVKLTEASW